ncbi:hypothetical protein AB1284_26230 [Bacillus sp. S2(2024)]|uniref:hypothetical protein n=1 Tax=Bacillus sp. S2(2024) TaxID=3162887 RepID=UPI003D1A3D48
MKRYSINWNVIINEFIVCTNTKKVVLSSILGITVMLAGYQSDLEKARKESKSKEEVKTREEEKYSLNETEKIPRKKLKNELTDEVKKK